MIKRRILPPAVRRFLIYPIIHMCARIFLPGSLPLYWSPGKNWGDSLSPILAGMLSQKRVRAVPKKGYESYFAIGSILHHAHERTEVWGAGFIREGARLNARPRAIHAVRGPLTRAALLESGIECPEVYGDPALLLPYFYDPEVKQIYDYGIIPHYKDKDHKWVQRHLNMPDVKVIDVEGDVWTFVQSVKSCRAVLSSSLHGLICADAYGVPNVWIRLSNSLKGGSFKFRDYRLSIGADDPTPVYVEAESRLSDLARGAEAHPLRIDLKKLLIACPFLNETVRASLDRDS